MDLGLDHVDGVRGLNIIYGDGLAVQALDENLHPIGCVCTLFSVERASCFAIEECAETRSDEICLRTRNT